MRKKKKIFFNKFDFEIHKGIQQFDRADHKTAMCMYGDRRGGKSGHARARSQ